MQLGDDGFGFDGGTGPCRGCSASRGEGARREDRPIASATHASGAGRGGAFGRANLLDRAFGLLRDPSVVTWRCLGCGWELWCTFNARHDVQTCEDCGRSQRIPSRAFQWNERMMLHLEQVQEASRERRHRRLEADIAARLAADRRREEVETQRRASLRLAAASIAVGAGLWHSFEAFETADDADVRRVLALASMARALGADLQAAASEAASADGGERAVREGAGWGSVACLIFGSFWMAAGLGAASLAAREIARDWKRTRAGLYRRRWETTMSTLDHADKADFARLFKHLHPQLATLIGD